MKRKSKKYYRVNWSGENELWGIIEYIKENRSLQEKTIYGKIVFLDSSAIYCSRIGENCNIAATDCKLMKLHEYVTFKLLGDKYER